MFNKFQTQIAVGAFALIWAFACLYFIISQPKHGVQVIDCRIAEISPDIPVDAKEQCRKARSGRI
jgi:hypothetical protein